MISLVGRTCHGISVFARFCNNYVPHMHDYLGLRSACTDFVVLLYISSFKNTIENDVIVV